MERCDARFTASFDGLSDEDRFFLGRFDAEHLQCDQIDRYLSIPDGTTSHFPIRHKDTEDDSRDPSPAAHIHDIKDVFSSFKVRIDQWDQRSAVIDDLLDTVFESSEP